MSWNPFPLPRLNLQRESKRRIEIVDVPQVTRLQLSPDGNIPGLMRLR